MLVKVIILDNKPVEVKIIGKAVIVFSTNIEI